MEKTRFFRAEVNLREFLATFDAEYDAYLEDRGVVDSPEIQADFLKDSAYIMGEDFFLFGATDDYIEGELYQDSDIFFTFNPKGE